MVHEIRVEEDKEKPRESAKPLDPVRGRQPRREVSDPSSRENSLSPEDRDIFSRQGSQENSPLSSRENSPSPEDRLDRLVRPKTDESIVRESMSKLREKVGGVNKTDEEKREHARSMWKKVKEAIVSQKGMFALMYLDGGLDNAAKDVGNPEARMLGVKGGGGGGGGGGMPPMVPNSDVGKEGKSDKTPEKTTKGGARVPESASRETTEPQKLKVGVPEGGTAKKLTDGAMATYHEREAQGVSKPLHENTSVMSGGLVEELIEIEYA